MRPDQVTRLGIFLAAILVVATGLAVFLPIHNRGDDCGQWWNPTYSDAEAEQLIRDAAILGDARQAVIAERLDECSSKLDNRRALSIGLGAAALLVPAGLWFVVGDGRRKPGAGG